MIFGKNCKKINDFLTKIAKNDFSFFRDEKMLNKIAKKQEKFEKLLK